MNLDLLPCPWASFLVLVKLIPYGFGALSRSCVHLFADMMASQGSVKILCEFAWTILCINDFLYFIRDFDPLYIILTITRRLYIEVEGIKSSRIGLYTSCFSSLIF